MGMKITTESLDMAMRSLNSAETDVCNAVIRVFAKAGKLIVEKVRSGELSNWMDVSGNLRSSVGGVVCSKGRVVEEFGFEEVSGGSVGANVGRDVANRIAAQYAQYDTVLIIVAGMDYAVYVEAVNGKVVLSAAWLRLEKLLPTMLREEISNVLKSYEKRY